MGGASAIERLGAAFAGHLQAMLLLSKGPLPERLRLPILPFRPREVQVEEQEQYQEASLKAKNTLRHWPLRHGGQRCFSSRSSTVHSGFRADLQGGAPASAHGVCQEVCEISSSRRWRRSSRGAD